MQVTVKHRDKKYEIKIDREDQVLELRKQVEILSEIKLDNFCLQVNKVYLLDDKPISKYLEQGIEFTMSNVTIKVIVSVNGQNFDLFVKEITIINDFKKEIIDKTGVKSGITLKCNNQVLSDEKTILSCEVENNASILAVLKIKVTVKHRIKKYEIEIDKEDQVLELMKRVEILSYIRLGNFRLKVNKVYLLDDKPISKYLEEGIEFTMADVTIQVTVNVKGSIFYFFVKEIATINDFKKDIINKTGVKGDIKLTCNNKELSDEKTILSGEVENNDAIIAVANIRGGKTIEELLTH